MRFFANIFRSIFVCLAFSFSLPLSSQILSEKTNRYNTNGQPYGRFDYYYNKAEKIIHSTGRYRNGKPVGKWLTYYENGARYIKARHYKNKVREVRYYQNGKLEKKGWSKLILNDPSGPHYYWDGKWKLYDENGKLFRVLVFSEGRVIDVIKNLNPEKEGIIYEE